MSLTTESKKSTIPISTFTVTSDGVVQTGTVASVIVSVITGTSSTTMMTGLNTVFSTTSVNGTPLTGASLITDTGAQPGTAFPIRAPSMTTSSVWVTANTSVIATIRQLTTTTETIATSEPVKTVTSTRLITTVGIQSTNPGSLSSASASSTVTLLTTMQPSATPNSSGLPTSTSRVTTTLITVTTATSSSTYPPTTPIPAVPPSDHMSSLWWVSIPVTLGVLVIIALFWLWRKCACRSFDKASCFLHAVFETIGGIIFGKRWDEWKAIRHENRRKKADSKKRLSNLDDNHIRNYFLNRWNDTTESHKNQRTIPQHSSSPSTALGGETWRTFDIDTQLSSPRPEAVEMTSLGDGAQIMRDSHDMYSDFPQEFRRNRGKGREIPSRPSGLPTAPSRELRAGIFSTDSASPLPVVNEKRFNSVAPWPEPPQPGASRQLRDDESLVSHNQWFPREVDPADLRRQIQKDVEAKRKSILRDMDTQSNASFTGARGVWPVINPQPVPLPANTPPLAAAVTEPAEPPHSSSLPQDHPILRLPSPEPLPGEPKRSFSQLYVSPLKVHRPVNSQSADATAPGTDCGAFSNQVNLKTLKSGTITSFLGWNKQAPNKDRKYAPQIVANLSQLPSPPTPIPEIAIPNRFHTSQLATRRTSISEWTDATVPPTERSSSPPFQNRRWASKMAAGGPGYSSMKPSISSLFSGKAPTSFPETDHAPSPQHTNHTPRGQHRTPEPKVPGWNTERQNMMSAYSGYWEDGAGGKIEYDHHGRIKNVEFQDRTVVPLVSEGSSEVDLERGRSRNRSQVDLNHKGYQRNERGMWI